MRIRSLGYKSAGYVPDQVAGPDLVSRGVRASIQQFPADIPGVTVPFLPLSTLISRCFFLGKGVV